MKKITLITFITAITLLTVSCSKNEDEPTPSKKTVFTISVKDLNIGDQDRLNVVIGGTDSQGNVTQWKKNGVLQSNETVIALQSHDLTSGEVTIEAASAVKTIHVNMSAINFNEPYTLKYQAIINGDVKNDMTETVSDSFIKAFTY